MTERIGKSFYVYMTASKPRGVIYTGMTSELAWRAQQHRDRLLDGFTKTYWVGRLVYFEPHETAAGAQRRDWKIALIEMDNPTWRDLYDDVLRLDGFEP